MINISEYYKSSGLEGLALRTHIEVNAEHKVVCPCLFGGKWKQKTLFPQKHWEYSFLFARNHALFTFASSFLTTVVSIGEMINKCHMDLLNLSNCTEGVELHSNDLYLACSRGTSEFIISLALDSGFISGSPGKLKQCLAPNPESLEVNTSVALKLPR